MAESRPAPVRVAAALEALLTPCPARIGLAVSGGSDSMALLSLTLGWASGRAVDVHVATVDHALRPESRSEAEQVAAFCAARAIPHQILTIAPLAPGGNLSALARDARYGALGAWAHVAGISHVLLGHTLDDQAETVLMRLARGSGVEGLSGMAPRRRSGGIDWLRPLLDVRRDALRAHLCGEEIRWIDDPTNLDAAYDRVKARSALATLAGLGVTPEGLASTAQRLADQREVLEAASRDLAGRALDWGLCGEARLALGPVRAALPDTALRLFGDLLRTIGGGAYRPRYRALRAAFDEMCASAAPRSRTLAGCVIEQDPAADGLILWREPAAIAAPAPASAGPWDGRWTLSHPVPDCLIGALGTQGTQSLQVQADAGHWEAPARWRDTPARIRKTAPALWRQTDTGALSLLGVPAAHYLCPAHGAPVRAVEIRPARPDAASLRP